MSRLNSVQLAGALPRNADFRTWVARYSVPPRDVTVLIAEQFIRDACGVQSRRELATNPEAAQRLETLVRRPFVAWRESQSQPA